MTRGLPATGQAAVENELLAQLGLPPSASPEDVDNLHQAVSEYLASAPPSIRGWAHAQAAALDEAYLLLTDPVGLEGSALRSPARPPAVVPGGPATPPARRGPVPEAGIAPASAGALAAGALAMDAAIDPADAVGTVAGDPDLNDLEALYASVTPSAHRDMLPGARRRRRPPRPLRARPRDPDGGSTPVAAPRPAPNPWKRVVIGGVGIAVVAAIAFGVYQVGGGAGTRRPVRRSRGCAGHRGPSGGRRGQGRRPHGQAPRPTRRTSPR